MDYGKNYADWLYENIDQYKISESTYRITLPYLNRNNDCIEVYIIMQENGSYLITDNGETLNELEFSGFNIFTSDKRKSLLHSITISHGVSVTDDNQLTISCTDENLPLKKHMLSQCMIKISDLFHLSKPNVISFFNEDVKTYLDTYNIRYISDVLFQGKSGLTTSYDFVIPKSQDSTDRILKIVNNLDNSIAGNIAFFWQDTKEARKNETSLFVFIQDTDKKVSTSALDALSNYSINTVLWSHKDDFLDVLTK